MASLPVRTQGILAAGAMAILTLSVFVRSQYSGPETSVNIFHLGISQNDPKLVQSVVLQDIRSAPAQNLLTRVHDLIQVSDELNIRRVNHSNRRANVLVEYKSARYGVYLAEFYLQKPRGQWMIDADSTLGVMVGAPN